MGFMVCRERVGEATWGINGLSQMCEKPSAGYGWSVTDEKKRNNGVSLVYRCGTRLYLWEDKCRVASYCVKKH